MRGANCGDGPPNVEIEGHHQYKKKTQSERNYETRKAEHKHTEKHQPRGEFGVGNGQCTGPIIGR